MYIRIKAHICMYVCKVSKFERIGLSQTQFCFLLILPGTGSYKCEKMYRFGKPFVAKNPPKKNKVFF